MTASLSHVMRQNVSNCPKLSGFDTKKMEQSCLFAIVLTFFTHYLCFSAQFITQSVEPKSCDSARETVFRKSG